LADCTNVFKTATVAYAGCHKFVSKYGDLENGKMQSWLNRSKVRKNVFFF